MRKLRGNVFRLALLVGFFLTVPAPTEASKSTKPRLGALPQTCPTTAHQQVVNGRVHASGASPVWAGIYGNFPIIDLENGRIHVSPNSVHTRHGWGFKILWWIEPSLASKVVIHGWNLGTGQGVWFSMTVNRKFGLLDPAKGSIGDNGWKFYTSEEYIASAGCYVLYAQWKSGGWVLPLAIGR